jgi:hypothetical protein
MHLQRAGKDKIGDAPRLPQRDDVGSGRYLRYLLVVFLLAGFVHAPYIPPVWTEHSSAVS